MATAKQEICDVTMFRSTNFKLFKKYVTVGSTCSTYSGAGHILVEILAASGGRVNELVTATGYEAEWAGYRVPVRARFSVLVQTGPTASPAFFSIGTPSLSLG